MRVGTMPEVMKERSCHGQERLGRIPFLRILLFKNLCDASCNLIDSQTVGKATVLTTMEGITGSPELFDPAKTLKFFCIDQVIDDLIVYMDVVVNWVTEYFFVHMTIIAKSCSFW